MKKIYALIGLLYVATAAHAVQELTLKEYPPLKPLTYCKHADGSVAGQNGPCGLGDTEVSSVSEMKSDGTSRQLPLAPTTTQTPDPVGSPTTAADGSSNDQTKPQTLTDAWKSLAQWAAFGVAIGFLAKLLNRSFFRWFVFGLLLRMFLVAANLMKF